ncbi:MAG: P-II family nitrogen regulator [Gammaproteobacteria bacterium]
MKYRKVTAIIPDSSLRDAEEALAAIGISGITVSKAHGYGEYRNYYAEDNMNDCSRIEIFTEAEKAKSIADAIAGSVHHGLKTDGVIAILPVEEFMHIHEYNK